MTTHLKICGITTLDDALRAVEAGADLLGFNFYPPSPRYLRPEDCARLLDELRRRSVRVTTVGVFVNLPPEQMRAILDGCGLDLAQLSGDEPPEWLEALGERGLKALRPNDAEALEAALRRYSQRTEAPAWLVDAYRPGEWGGTGQRADWGLARSLAAQAPILLAGGITPENAAAALEQVRPWGLDVASGVESSPGRKDPRKLRELGRVVRRFEGEVATYPPHPPAPGVWLFKNDIEG